MKLHQNNWFRSVVITLSLIFISLFHLPASIASDLILIRTPSTGYQPQFQVSGNRIYYVWHEDHGPIEPIWVAEEIVVE